VNISATFISRPVATTLLTIGVAMAGFGSYFLLPVSPLPQVDLPTIQVQASLPGASPETVATSVSTPLERHLGQIADVTEMTSQSSLGQSRITLQFGLDRDIDGAARDVEAAINAARADLPSSLRSNPTYRKINPADAPIMVLAMTSKTLSQAQLYDAGATVLQQSMSQISGVGQVLVAGSSLPAVRVELNPHALFSYRIGPEDVRAALAATNANSPKGSIEDGVLHFQIYTNDQARTADQYRNLIIAYRNNNAVRLSDVAEIVDSVEDLRNQGLSNGEPSVLVIVFRQPGANIITTVDRVVAMLPQLSASIPADINLINAIDRTTTIRASLHDVQLTLMISIALVVMVVFIFLRNLRATMIPSVAVPVSLLGTFGIMYLLGYSLDNLSLMALTVATGFVVDDAVVVLENITRHLEAGMRPVKAALTGAGEVGFTVLSISVSLVAVFVPILLMGGILGRMFREFAVTLSAAVMVSLVVSLTTTPMMCAYLLRPDPLTHKHGWLYRMSEHGFAAMNRFYELMIFIGTVVLLIVLFSILPKGFIPQQDTGRLIGFVQADQNISFQLMQSKMREFLAIVKRDPAVENVVGFTGGGQTNGGQLFVSLKPLAERKRTSDQVIARIRTHQTTVPGASMFLQAVQDIRVGGRASQAQYQYTLQSDNLPDLQAWAPKVLAALQHTPGLADVNTDQQDKGLEGDIVIDRATASKLGLTITQIDNTLYDAFGQRQVSTIYNALNQYHVVMEVAPQYRQTPETLNDIFVSTSGLINGSQQTNAVAGTTNTTINATSATTSSTSAAAIANDAVRNQATNSIAAVGKSSTATSAGSAVSSAAETMVPLSAFTRYQPGTTPLAINHQGLFAATTISFNLPPGKSLSDAVVIVNEAMNQLGVPQTIHGSFQGTAQAFQASLSSEPLLILAALVAVYIVLGVLYESYIHPLTILSTLPSGMVGALMALLLTGSEFNIIALIGVILLIGIVKKNAIMMIDFALAAERAEGLTPRDAIFKACLLRFRPIMMTTAAALFGAIPLAIGMGEGSELRQPLGITIVGGLIFSQALTLYTTPVIYLCFESMAQWSSRQWRRYRSPNIFGVAPGAGE
jgi:multidrug efflux pump